MRNLLILLNIFVMFNISCKKQESTLPQSHEVKGMQTAQLKKIPITDPSLVDNLLSQGLDVIVVEKDYVVIRISPEKAQVLDRLQLQAEPIQEQDLVQRLVKIPISTQQQVNELANLGMDIWEVKKDTVVAQAFDKYIREAEKLGFKVEVVKRNALDIVKKH